MSDLKKIVGILFMAIGGFGIFFMFTQIALLLIVTDSFDILINSETLFNNCMSIAR